MSRTLWTGHAFWRLAPAELCFVLVFARTYTHTHSHTRKKMEKSGPKWGPKSNLSAVTPGIVPVKVVIRRPRAILKEEHLMSRRGVAALPTELAGAPFRGRGHELEDLRLLLAKARHWAHRVLPTSTFEDFVEKAERLGAKKRVRNHVNRIVRGDDIRFHDDDPADVVMKSDDENDDNDNGGDNRDDNGDRSQASTSKTAAAAAAAAPKTESEKVFERIFRDHIEKMKQIDEEEEEEAKNREKDKTKAIDENDDDKRNSIETKSKTTDQAKLPPIDEFVMDDDDDDFDEDFLASFQKP